MVFLFGAMGNQKSLVLHCFFSCIALFIYRGRKNDMSKMDIIDKWYREGVVQFNVKHYKGIEWDEVISMIYADLCEKPEELIQHLEETNTYRFFISRMVSNQIISNDSPYRRQNRLSKASTDIEPYTNTFSEKVSQNALNCLEMTLTGDDLLILDMVANFKWNKGYRVRPITDIKEYYNCSLHRATKIYDKWEKKVKKILKSTCL